MQLTDRPMKNVPVKAFFVNAKAYHAMTRTYPCCVALQEASISDIKIVVCVVVDRQKAKPVRPMSTWMLRIENFANSEIVRLMQSPFSQCRYKKKLQKLT
jgi:hypothetical protein